MQDRPAGHPAAGWPRHTPVRLLSPGRNWPIESLAAVAEGLRGLPITLNVLQVHGPLQQSHQVRAGNAQSDPCQEDAPDRFGIQHSAGHRRIALCRHCLQQPFGDSTMFCHARIKVAGLEQLLDDLPVVDRVELPPGEPHADVGAILLVGEVRQKDQGRHAWGWPPGVRPASPRASRTGRWRRSRPRPFAITRQSNGQVSEYRTRGRRRHGGEWPPPGANLAETGAVIVMVASCPHQSARSR